MKISRRWYAARGVMLSGASLFFSGARGLNIKVFSAVSSFFEPVFDKLNKLKRKLPSKIKIKKRWIRVAKTTGYISAMLIGAAGMIGASVIPFALPLAMVPGVTLAVLAASFSWNFLKSFKNAYDKEKQN